MKAKETPEPTLYDVIQAMQRGFAHMETRFQQHDFRFDSLDNEIHLIKQRLFKIELKLEDKSDTIQNHEERLGSLESWQKGFGMQGMAGA